MLNILFLTHRLPYPPDRGDRIRSYNLIRYLAPRHRLHLASVVDGPTPPDHVRHLETLCASVDVARVRPLSRQLSALCYLPTTTPLTLPLFASRALKAAISRRLRDHPIDLIFIYSSAMAQYVRFSHAPKVIDFIDADSQKWFDYARSASWPTKAIYWREGSLLRRYEAQVARSCVHAFTASAQETDLLQKIAPHIPFTTIRNGVKPSLHELPASDSRTLVFTGVMDYRPNVDAMTYFVTEILPRVRSRVPDARLLIVGQKPTREVRRLEDVPGVTVTGWVSDVYPYLESAALFVAPLRIARGIQNKVLEAMAAALPIVCTSSALGRLDAVPGRDLMVADDAGPFSDHIVTLLEDRDQRRALGQSALAYVRRHHDWEKQLAHWETMLVETARRHQRIAAQPLSGDLRELPG